MSVLFKDVRLLDFNAAAGMSDSRDLRVVNGTIEQIETTLAPRQGERVIWGMAICSCPVSSTAIFIHPSIT